MKTIKRLFISISLMIIILIVLQLFGGRDFTQIDLAIDKYHVHDELSVFMSDISLILKGKKVRQGDKLVGERANKIMYKWVDTAGQIHVSDRQPDVDNFEIIRLGDVDHQTVEGLSEEEIEQALKK
jgi:hypothetical protein